MATDGAPDVCENEWQVDKSLADCLLYMLDQEIDCDVTFSVNFEDDPPQQISAHKFLLKARSPVFQNMFSGSRYDTDDIHVSDMKAITLRETLRYMYSEDVSLTGNNVLKLLYSANKYKLQKLVDICTVYLAANLDHNKVCPILTDALVYKKEEVIEKCLSYIGKNTQNVLGSDSFLELSHAALWKIVQEPRLEPKVEGRLYERCVEWAKHQGAKTDQEIRSLLGDCINHICFLTLTPAEFSNIAGPSQVLTRNEQALMLLYGSSHDPQYSQTLKEMGFSTKTRVTSIRRVKYTPSIKLQFPSTTNESFTLSCDSRIDLVGFTVDVQGKTSECDVKVKISFDGEIVLSETTTKVVSDDTDGSKEVLLKDRVQLQPGVSYTMELQVSRKTPFHSHDTCSVLDLTCGNVKVKTTVVKWATGFTGLWPRTNAPNLLFETFAI